MKNIVLILTASLFVASCAHHSSKTEITSSEKAMGEPSKFRVTNVPVVAPTEELEIIPTELNANVDKWINYFQGRGRPHMERYLLRSTRYEALMKKVLRDNKLPEDLFYIALIESGFSSQAFSHASAVGYWQFIRGTGKRYNLKIDQLIDERRDPVLSTQAAAEYFKDLYAKFNSWYLAMASYNVGEGRVDRAVRKYKTHDFWQLTKNKRALPRETDDYIPKYIAAKLIAKNPDKYGFEGLDYLPPIEFDHITVNNPINLRLMAEKMNINYEDFKALNPKYKGEIAPLDSENILGLRIPPGSYEVAMNAAKESISDKVEFVADQDEIQPYKIRRGDTFANVARRYKTTVAYLRDINDFPRKKKLRVGQSIFVPDRTPLKEKRPELVGKFYIVQPGDSLASIAVKYKVSISDLTKANNLSRKSKIKSGVKLVLPENAALEDSKPQKNSSQSVKNKNRKVAGGKKVKRNIASKK
ncbi:MAG: transglycosylase SLT domain-containing protein [Bdellovibrionaceae bacterium]|nr:transglycosylase SLT domain-containing protein [Bdellovibrio sp.]